MKKTFFAGLFFIVALLIIFGACGKDKEKIRPETRIDNGNNIIIQQEDGGNKTEGGKTDLIISDGEIKKNEIVTQPKVEVRESYLKNKDTAWTVSCGMGEVLDALNTLDMRVATVGHIEVAQRNDQDCATTISVGGRILSAYDFKEAMGLKSTMITEIKREGNEFVFSGKGEN